MCERVKKAKIAFDRYQTKADNVHHLAEMVMKDIAKIQDQLLILEIIYFAVSEMATDDYERHHQHCDEIRLAKKQEQGHDKAVIPPSSNGSKGLRFF